MYYDHNYYATYIRFIFSKRVPLRINILFSRSRPAPSVSLIPERTIMISTLTQRVSSLFSRKFYYIRHFDQIHASGPSIGVVDYSG